MRYAGNARPLIGPLLAVVLCLAAFGSAFGGVAQAASPAWKLLAVTGPTNIPPRQSETQRVTVEAEDGTFTLGRQTPEGEGTFPSKVAGAEVTEGSNSAKIPLTFEAYSVGELVISEGGAFPPGTTVIGVTPEGEGASLELSNPAVFSSGFELLYLLSKEVTGVTLTQGAFRVGDEIEAEILPSGTQVTAVSGGMLSISKFPTSMFGGTYALKGPEQSTGPLPFNAPASVVQEALEALPPFGPGSVTASGGPGGAATSPYFVSFGGPVANMNVEELVVDGSALDGPHPLAQVFTTVPGGPGTGNILISPTNIGGAPTAGLITVRLGPLPGGIVTSGPGQDLLGHWTCPGGSGESTVTCTLSEPVPALASSDSIIVPVEVDQTATSNSSVPVTIEGGSASPSAYQVPISISNQQAPFGVQAFWAGAFDSDGNPVTQAGAHPYSAQTLIRVNTVRSASGRIVPAGDSKNVVAKLPPGFVGNPLITPRCPQAELTIPGLGGSLLCNKEMSVGILRPILTLFEEKPAFDAEIFNNVPAQGHAAEFTTKIGAPLQSLLGSVRGSEDFGVTILAPNNPNINKIFGTYAVLRGEPAGAPGRAFLDNPTACAQQREESAQGRGPWTLIEASSWQAPSVADASIDPLPLLTNCRPLTEAWIGNGPDPANEKPSFGFEPSSTAGSSAVGATARLHIPQTGLTDPNKLVTSHLKKAVVTLPEGLVVNPSSANGLQACSESQMGLLGTNEPSPTPIRFDEKPPSCPDGSKLGTFEVSTPVLEEKVGGTIYLAAQEDNPFDSLIALYLVVESPRFGLMLKLAGEVKPDPSRGGQLTATFDNNPQLPVEDLVLHFRGGQGAELATPEVCGHYATTGALTPWSAEAGEAATIDESGFSVTSNCSSSAGARPFSPAFEAGTIEPKAGSHSPMVIRINRKDGEQELDRLDFTLPLGVVGKLAGIPYCSDPAIAAAKGKSGKSEIADPSCPSASQLGLVDTAAGVGSEPVHVGGRVYLAGPYKGAPISTVVVTPAVAGPFDLGTVVIRAPAYVHPETAQITIKSDPVPTMLRGLQLKLRSVLVYVDRPNFILNPTNCEPQAFGASLHSSNGASATPANRFQAGGCDKLKFKPKLKLALKGGTKRNGHPSLVATLRQPAGQANIGRVSVALPHSEFLDQGHIRTICTRVQFAAHQCPKGAIYGYAEAVTPLLDQPLRGPVYLRSSSHKLPDLVAALRGPDSQPIEIALDGRIDSVHEGIRNTFEVVPDAPVSRFVLRMQGGKKGLLVNSTNICRGKHKAAVRMTGQNGKLHNFSTPLKARCGGKAKGKKKGAHKQR